MTAPSNCSHLVESFAQVYPWSVEPGEDVRSALSYLGSDTDAETVVLAGYVLSLPLTLVSFAFVSLLAPRSPIIVRLCASLAVGLAGTHAVHRLPVVAARLRRTRALGETPALVGRATLRMRLGPTPERAASFAAHTADGPLADSLAEHVRRARGTPNSGFESFAREWRDHFPALERAISLLLASADAQPDERERGLERALDAVLDGTRDELASFAADVRGPTTGVYAFGVLLPLALVGVLPAARAGGVAVPTAAFVAVYDLLLPLGLVAASAWILLRRPVALAPPRVDSGHPDVPSSALPAVGAGVFCGIVGWFVGSAVAPWADVLTAAGTGVGAGLVGRYYPMARVRERVREVESGLDDVLSLVGRRVSAGDSVEVALESAADAVSTPAGAVFADAAGVRRRLRVSVREAFLGRYGVLADVPSPRTRAAAALLSVAAMEGRPAGHAVVATADHLSELRRVESEARRELASVTGTLSNTAALFAPLVGGATVAMAARMGAADTALVEDGAQALGPELLGTAVGAYVLVLAVVLTTLATGLDRGLDRTLVGYRVGLALLSATAAYLAAFRGAALVF
ncbi:type II secretion system protein [Halogeometricum borinquense]|uniref:Type II secretion system protein n=1 Tax=Halogeometricum borinquense TaxID=60847 RepID=A0A6C0UDH1_9EURY|nr:type II secretion system protein [Halogeometricum borinquense]QIB73375.1 type II secretion system protein [Halogeometricum borinquense]QIQ77226.1 type II secretion system protein [Halogeometricum borinquense]